MKTGRNDPCYCGSCKKYKKCCLNKQDNFKMNFSKDYFNLKGKKAEEIVHALAQKTFFIDWCFLNPKWPDGKELCDLLVIFDEVAIIWQIKDLKLNKFGKYNKSEVEKNLKQLSGARRKLFDLKADICLENSRRKKEKYNSAKIKEVYLISVLLGEGEEVSSFIEEDKNGIRHIFTKEFTQIVLNELDTINDFVGYLRIKEKFLKKNKGLMVIGGEQEFLAHYLINGRNFDEFENFDNVIIPDGLWEHFQNKAEYLAKKKADGISYGWDSMVNRAYECSPEYEKVARELARPNRFQRRYLSKAFFEAYKKAHEASKDKKYNCLRRMVPGEGTTYCFIFQDDVEPRNSRRTHLGIFCEVARGTYQQNTKVLGIATEMKSQSTCSYDLCFLDMPEWTEENQMRMEKNKNELKVFINPTMSYCGEDEYPKIDK
ncbi:MAG: SEC-C metal-binding domain-containing protein [Thermodesulfovibrionales bacterium]|jgi:hypothetical protein